MKIATFNINGIGRRLPNLLAWLEQARPDVVCLQELKVADDAFPERALSEAGYRSIRVAEGRWNGVAILSRGAEPIPTAFALPGDDDDGQARYVEAAVRGIIVGCLYLPNGNPWPGPKFDYKLRWFERLIGRARALREADVPAVLAGDFNVVPSAPDIYLTRSYDENALCRPESRDAYARLLDQGWMDAERVLHPDGSRFTFWDYKRQRWPRDAGLRLDHILLSPALGPRLRESGVDRDIRGEADASDHAPVWATLAD